MIRSPDYKAVGYPSELSGQCDDQNLQKLSLPKKAALEAIGMFEMAYGGGTATAHDVFMAMQEIPYILKSDHAPESKMLVVEENMARALTLRWGDYDLAKAVSY